MCTHESVLKRIAIVASGALLIANASANAQTTSFTGNGDGTSWTDGLNWDAGEPNGAGFDAVIDGASGSPFDVELNANRLVDTLTIGNEDILRVLNSHTLEVGTTIDNVGSIRLLSTGSFTDLRIETAVALTGGGSIQLDGSAARILDATGTIETGHLTNVDNLIFGEGNIGFSRTQLTNHGTIQASVDGGMLIVDPAVATMVNDGLLEATQLSTLRLDSGTYNNLGGTIRAQNGSVVELFSGPSITNGSLVTLGTGVIETGNATLAKLDSVSLDGFLRINNSDGVELIGTLTSTPTSTILVNSTGSSTDLVIEGAVTLTGGGTIQMMGNAARILDETGFSDTGHLINTDHLIHGQGNIGANRTQLTNNATIRADVAGNSLELDPGAGGMVNTGLLEATSGATLRLNNGTYTNTGGTILAQNNSVVELFSGPVITNGTLQTTGTGVIQTGNATLSQLDNVTLDGLLQINNSDNLQLIGTFTSNPTSVVQINSAGSLTDLTIEGLVTLTGGGEIEMIGAQARILDETGATDGHLVNNDHLIHGQGNVGFNRTQITNHSTIRADVLGQTLQIDPDLDGMVNDGLLEATNGATLELNSADYDNSLGTIRAQTGSTITLLNGPSITNGTLQTVGSGVIQTGNATASKLTDVTLDGLLQIDNTDNLELIGTLTTNAGSTIRIQSTGSNTDLQIEGPVTLTGGGTIEMNGINARILDENSTADGHLTNQDHLIHGRGNIGVNRMQLTNHGTIRADVAGQALEIDPNLAGAVNTNLIEATNGATLRLNTGDFTNTGGTIRADDTSTVLLVGAPTISGGTLQTVGSGLFLTGDATVKKLDGVTIDGRVQVDNADNIELQGTVTNNPGSVITINSAGSNTDLLIESNVVLNGGGTIEMVGTAARILDEGGVADGHLTNTNNLIHGRGNIGVNRMQLTNGGTIAADVAVQTLFIDVNAMGLANTGTLRAENTALLHIQDGFANDGNIVAAVDSTVRIDGTLTNNANGVLSGNGDILMGNTGTGNIQNDGTIAPGASAGLLSIDAGTVTFGTTGRLELEIGGLTAGTDFDRVNVFGDVAVDGTIDATLFGGYTPAIGDVFDVLVASGSVTGSFSNALLPAGPGDGFGVFVGPNFVRISVGRIPGDLNFDGFVGIADLNIVLGNWNLNVTPGDDLQGDPTGDGFVGIADLNQVLGNWNGGTPYPAALTPPAAGASVVPEPATAGVLLLGAAGLFQRRRARA